MKTVLSVSLGSSKRNHCVETSFLGVPFRIERIGTDGDLNKAMQIVRELDGKVDAFGLGGIDLYLYAGDRRYIIRDAYKIARQAKMSPVVDGSGLKNTLERNVITFLQKNHGFDLRRKPVLMVCGVDRFGMAQSFVDAGAIVTFGDLVFGLGLPVPLKSLKSLERTAKVVAPVVCRLPFKFIYPTGKKQEKNSSRHRYLYYKADIIAGDYHYIKKYMPEEMPNKIVITNTVTKDDVEDLKRRGVKVLVTTTPELNGRSFGTNVMEGVLLALAGKRPENMTEDEYSDLLAQTGFGPRVEYLN